MSVKVQGSKVMVMSDDSAHKGQVHVTHQMKVV